MLVKRLTLFLIHSYCISSMYYESYESIYDDYYSNHNHMDDFTGNYYKPSSQPSSQPLQTSLNQSPNSIIIYIIPGVVISFIMFAIICYSHRGLLMELCQGANRNINNPITNHQDNHIWQELKNRNEWQELEEKKIDDSNRTNQVNWRNTNWMKEVSGKKTVMMILKQI